MGSAWEGGTRRPRGAREECSPLRLALIVLLCGVASSASAEVVLVDPGSVPRYRANASDPSIGTSWTTASYDDTAWTTGSYGIGFDGGGSALSLLGTIVPSSSVSVYTRVPFTVANAAAIQTLF